MQEHSPLRPLTASQKESLKEATDRYAAALGEDVEAVRYLVNRGIEEEAAVTFQCGVVHEPEPGHERFQGMLAIPYLSHEGYPLAIRFRCIQEHDHRAYFHGKYTSIAGEPSRMFNVGAIHRAQDVIHVTEGEFDAIILNQLGLPAVAVPGASSFQGHHRRMLAGFNRVWLWSDPDEAGAELTNKVTRMMGRAKGVRLRDGDVTETFLLGGADAIHQLIESDS